MATINAYPVGNDVHLAIKDIELAKEIRGFFVELVEKRICDGDYSDIEWLGRGINLMKEAIEIAEKNRKDEEDAKTSED